MNIATWRTDEDCSWWRGQFQHYQGRSMCCQFQFDIQPFNLHIKRRQNEKKFDQLENHCKISPVSPKQDWFLEEDVEESFQSKDHLISIPAYHKPLTLSLTRYTWWYIIIIIIIIIIIPFA